MLRNSCTDPYLFKYILGDLKDTDGVERLPAGGQHVVEGVAGQLLDPILDHPVRDQHLTNAVFVVVRDAEQTRFVTCNNIFVILKSEFN